MSYFASGLLILTLVPLPAWGQTPPADPNPPSAASPLAVNPLTGLTSASASNYHALTGSDRWLLYWKQNYWSVGAYSGPVLSALVLDQATGSPHEWGGGFEGFGHRLGSRTLSAMIQGSFQAALAAPLHEDVRYISSGRPGIGCRVLHAFAFSFLTYNSQGHTTLNIANLTGYYAGIATSTSWTPIHESLGRYTLIHGTEQVGLAIPVNLLQEFWPDIHRTVFRHP